MEAERTERFLARIRRLTARRSANREQPALRALSDAARPAPEAIERAVAMAVRAIDADASTDRSLARRLAALARALRPKE